MRKYLVLITVVCSILMVQTASADLVVNGGFETGIFSGWTTIPATPAGTSDFGVSNVEPH
jgi:hypothetical protein